MKACARNFGRGSVQGCLTFLVAKQILLFSPACSKRYRTYLRRSRNAPGLMKEMAGTVSARSTRLSGARVATEAQLEAARSRLSRLKDIERGKYALISHYASLAAQGLADLPL